MMWSRRLTDWFRVNQRQMPWRDDPLPYFIWVSEMMLQQTQVDTVIPYFHRFVARFPTVVELASADQQDVLKLWEGLGYYSRARNFHKAAQLLVSDYNGELPTSYEELQKLSGIGPYCAAAILSIAFQKPIPVVDGNVLRVFARFWGIEDDIRQAKVRVEIFNRLMPFIKKEKPADFNQGIMELGALICKPQKPLCNNCPISSDCYACKNNKVSELPFKSKSAKSPHYEIGVGVIWRGDQLLIAKRKVDQMLGGLWEFPGGKRQPQETLEETTHREILEETGLDVKVGAPYPVVKHAYTHFKITMTAFHCMSLSGEPVPNSSDELKWVSVSELAAFPFPKATLKVIESFRIMKNLKEF
ncbi:MAG: A/G-specific adenine glycosylase [Candidatus Margulisbacteria bacterium]|nr:A/G-specific adenine glycosylase [Candidatus Margulisiibacteriota bacterium]